VPVDHLHGHVASLYLRPEPLDPPFLCLLASGGHTLLLDVQDRSGHRVVGTTLDDAAGEAFDKGARLLGLGYPGGAALDRAARDGDPGAHAFPVARVPGFDFSFSGLKTALLYAVRDLPAEALERRRGDLAASYQRAIATLPGATLAPLALCTDNAAMIASAARYAAPIPFPEYLALDAYATAA
jgi:N6-L-threonylcarbamoyladenine synthase